MSSFDVMTEAITGPQASFAGPVANRLLQANMDPGALRPWFSPKDGRPYITINQGGAPRNMAVNTATLTKDEWIKLDTAVKQAAMRRLRGINMLRSRGLTLPIANALGTTVVQYQDISELSDAQMSMAGETRGRADRLIFDTKSIPLPIIHKDFFFDARHLAASRNNGQPLDTTTAEAAATKCSEYLENIFFNGTDTFTYGGGVIYGMTDFVYRNTVSLAISWDDSAATGARIISMMTDMKQASINDRHYGPWVVFVPTAYETVLDADYDATSKVTIRERILKIDGIQDIVVSDWLSTDNVIMLEMDSQTVRLIDGIGVTVLEWQTEGGMILHYKVMMIAIPQFRADQNNRSGLIHMS